VDELYSYRACLGDTGPDGLPMFEYWDDDGKKGLLTYTDERLYSYSRTQGTIYTRVPL